MSADAWANDRGAFAIVVRDYETGRFLGRLDVVGIGVNAPLQVEIVEGQDWPPEEAAPKVRAK